MRHSVFSWTVFTRSIWPIAIAFNYKCKRHSSWFVHAVQFVQDTLLTVRSFTGAFLLSYFSCHSQFFGTLMLSYFADILLRANCCVLNNRVCVCVCVCVCAPSTCNCTTIMCIVTAKSINLYSIHVCHFVLFFLVFFNFDLLCVIASNS